MKSDEKEIWTGLCWRCEHRACFHETGFHPRFECGEARAVHNCYMFMPTKPIAVGPIKGEKRPIFGPWFVAGRIQSHGLVATERLRLRLIDLGDGNSTAVWTIKNSKKEKA